MKKVISRDFQGKVASAKKKLLKQLKIEELTDEVMKQEVTGWLTSTQVWGRCGWGQGRGRAQCV